MFVPEKRTITKYERENIRITNEYVESLSWITDRDYEILKLLVKHQFLNTSQIEMMIFNDLKISNSRNRANDRLRRLYKANCIDRWYPPVERDAGSSEAHYVLDYAGAMALASKLGYTKKQFKFRKRDYIPQHYRHYLKIIDFKALLHVLNRQLGYTDEGTIGEIIRFDTEQMKKFHFTMDNKVHQGKLIPDAFCIYKYTARGDSKFFYLECDNATEPIETILGKVNNYRRYFASGEWRNEKWSKLFNGFPIILFIFHKDEQAKELIDYTRRINTNLNFMSTTYDKLYVDTFKEYRNSLGKRRLVPQSRHVKILEDIWYTNGITDSL
jgi:hypothetical protein